MVVIISHEKHYYHGKYFEICVIKTDLIKDPILAFGDFQECDKINNLIFDYAFDRLKDLGYANQCKEAISICCGDMYGETYFDDNGHRVEIRGSDGIINFSLYNRTKLFYYVYGNHDLLSMENKPNMVCLGQIDKPIKIDNNHYIIGINGIKSSKHSIPSHDSQYEKTTMRKLRHNPTILVTHEAPLILNDNMNPQSIGNRELMDLIKKFKPKIHFFGHCYFKIPFCLLNDILFVNVDSRFILFVN